MTSFCYLLVVCMGIGIGQLPVSSPATNGLQVSRYTE